MNILISLTLRDCVLIVRCHVLRVTRVWRCGLHIIDQRRWEEQSSNIRDDAVDTGAVGDVGAVLVRSEMNVVRATGVVTWEDCLK